MTAPVGGSRRVGFPCVRYAKKAKMVDVRKLKEDIRKSLDIRVPNPKDTDDESVVRISDSSVLYFSPPPQCDTVDYILRLVSNL